MTHAPHLLALLFAVVSGGCVRAGFGPGEDGHTAGPVDAPGLDMKRDLRRPFDAPGLETERGLIGPDGKLPASEASQHPNDTCATPRVVDLSTAPQQITVELAAAKNDYGFSCCAGKPEIVLRLENPNADYKMKCASGGGAITVVASLGSFVCPPADLECRTLSCSGGSFLILGSLGGVGSSMLVCRDPALGPAVISFY